MSTVCEAQFDAGFQNRAMAHVRYLAGLGIRVAGSDAELKAVQYIREQFETMGLDVRVEPFEFRSFTLKKVVLTVGGQKAVIERIALDPYAGITRLDGEVAFILPEVVEDQAVFSPLELKNRLVITQGQANVYRLASKAPLAVAFVSEPDFGRLRKPEPAKGTIEIAGEPVIERSANIVATLLPKDKSDREVILSAHLDSVRGPGANDNASGVAVLLELARYYRKLEPQPPFRLRLVALGAEEVGKLGAKAYLSRHLAELKNCSLVLNMDTIGGTGKMNVEMRDGVRGIAGKAVNQLPDDLMDKALTDVDSKWMHVPPSLHKVTSNVPQWLQQALKSTAKELHIDMIPSRGMGSDHQVFAQAGVAATNINISGAKSHTPEDTPEQITPASLEKAGQFVVGVVAKLPATD